MGKSNCDDASKMRENQKAPVCPYCSKNQSEWPKRSKKKCSSCGNTMFVRYKKWKREKDSPSNYYSSNPVLVTQQDAWRYDWIFNFFCIDLEIAITDFENKRASNEKGSGNLVSDRDYVWAILNKLLLERMKLPDYNELERIYRYMESFVKEENRDTLIYIQQANKMRLLSLKKHHCRKVMIDISSRSFDPIPCELCKSMANLVLPIDDAIISLPLPPPACHNKYCSTYFAQVFEDSDKDGIRITYNSK